MEVMTVQGIVENGQIRLTEKVQLPEHAVVYVVIPGVPQVHFRSPRLANPAQAADFAKSVEKIPNASL